MTDIERQQEALHFFDRHGLRPLTPIELFSITNAFSSELQAGLENPPRLDGLQMIDTHLAPIEVGALQRHVGEQALVLEIGGTNKFAELRVIGPDGRPEVMRDQYGNKLNHRDELRKTEFASPDEFFC